MEEPKLFIQTPPFYYIEVEKDDKEQEYFEESTSVYEISRSERIYNPIIARQLNFFSQPINRKRILQFHLTDGETIRGLIQEINGTDVTIKFNNHITIIDGNEITAITLL